MRAILGLIGCFLALPLVLPAQLADQSFLADAYEIAETEGRLEILNETEARYSERRRITILHEKSQANSFGIGYDSDNKIEQFDADIYDLSGTAIRKVRKSEIRDASAVSGGTMYDDSRVRYLELNHATYPYILEFTYTQRLKGIAFAAFPNWYFQSRGSTAVQTSTFTIVVPQNMDIQYQTYNIDLEPTIQTAGTSTTYTWTVKQLPAIKYEPLHPPLHQVLPLLCITPRRFKIDNYPGSMASWQAYGDFLYRLWRGRDAVPAALQERLNQLVADAGSDREKIERLYHFLQENKRYVSVQLGIGGWQPYDVNYVEERGYGDCKALSNYLKAILHAQGIESYPVILSAGSDHPYEVEDDFVDPDFNHALLYVPQEELWLECTSKNNPAGYLGRFCNDRRVLLVTPEGGQLARTPRLGIAENQALETVLLTIAPDGSATLDYKGELHGILSEEWRDYSFYHTPQEIENKVRQKGKLPNLQLATVAIDNAPAAPTSTLTFTAAAARYATRAGKRLFVPINLVSPFTEVPEPVAERHLPVVIPYGYSQEATFEYILPAGFRAESLPSDTDLETPYGKYLLTVSSTPKKVTIARRFQLSDATCPPTEYAAFREFLLEVARLDGSKLVLVQE